MKPTAVVIKSRLKVTLLALMFVATITGCQKQLHFDKAEEKDHNLVINFKAVVDTADLEFGTEYRNFFDEPYKVSAFRFYVSAIQMINTDSGKVFELPKDKYYLVDFADSAASEIRIGVQPFKYNRIAFTIGVDSARNVSGAQTGALDPTKGMFWTWNSGYIMAKLEGTSPAAATPNNAFEYHIGGFRTGENVVQKITLLFPFTTDIDLKPGKTTEMAISSNVNSWFYNPHDIMISANPTCMTPGPLALQVAENYRKMFTVVDIVNEP
jgi:methanobactin biosynthesis MbnP-like protein